MNKIYLIKNLTPWMVDELIAMSNFTQFSIILLRKPSRVYTQTLKILERNKIKILTKPFNKIPDIKRFFFSLSFIISHSNNFWGKKNFIFGVKAIGWFLILKNNAITPNSVIHAQFATQASIIALLYKLYFKHIEFSFTFHAHDIYYQNRWFSKLLNKSKKAISISDFNIEYVKNNYLIVDTNKIELSRLGVFLPSFKQNRKNSTFTIGFISWWEKKKGIDILLESVKDIVNVYNISFNLIIAGDGPLHKYIQMFINTNSLNNYIINRGKIFNEDKEKFYRDIDILVLPSLNVKNDMDGIPVVLMEAISYGIPIISTNISGIPEICKNKYNGLLVPPNNIQALTEAIVTFINMSKTQFDIYINNAFKISKSYDIIKNSKRKLHILEWNYKK